MAEINYQGSQKKTYYQIDKDGKLWRKAKEDETQFVYEHLKQEGKNAGKTERRKTVMALQGLVYDFYLYHSDVVGKQFIVEIFDNGSLQVLTIPADSSYYESFRRVIPNLKVGQEYQFFSWKMGKKDKDGKPMEGFVYGITVKQMPDLLKVESFFDKEKINQLCPVDQSQLDLLGKDYWKIYYVLLDKAFETRVIPHYRKEFEKFKADNPIGSPEDQNETVAATAPVKHDPIGGEESDLPF
jgi:hypothetical protein